MLNPSFLEEYEKYFKMSSAGIFSQHCEVINIASSFHSFGLIRAPEVQIRHFYQTKSIDIFLISPLKRVVGTH